MARIPPGRLPGQQNPAQVHAGGPAAPPGSGAFWAPQRRLAIHCGRNGGGRGRRRSAGSGKKRLPATPAGLSLPFPFSPLPSPSSRGGSGWAHGGGGRRPGSRGAWEESLAGCSGVLLALDACRSPTGRIGSPKAARAGGASEAN